jgi:cytochrome oxidase Cu insertion factor (SCO1/SenC/PrrC family)
VAANDRSVAPGPRSLRRLRLALWLVVLALAAAAAVLYLLLRSSGGSPGARALPVSATPAATWAAGAQRAPGFRLRDADGRGFTLASLRGRPVIVTFIDPLCRDYCPTEAKHLSDVVNSFPAGSRPAIVAVSVNTAGNSQRILRRDARKWRLVPEWRWGIGSERELSPVWRAYSIQVLVTSKQVSGVTVRDVGHTEAAYVIDAQGFERALFLWPYSAAGVVSVLRGLR